MYTLSQVEDLTSAEDTIEDESVVNWQVLIHDQLDSFLGGDSPEERTHAVEFASPVPQ